MSAKQIVAVFMGGRASEHDISLKTGTVVMNSLDRTRYTVYPVQLCRDGGWIIPAEPFSGIAPWSPFDEAAGAAPIEVALRQLRCIGPDVAFIALHGRFGEDGCVQGLLELLDIPYTGSDVMSSALAMDKVRSKQIVAYHRIKTPRWIVVQEQEWRLQRSEIIARVGREFGFPCVAKVPEEGSSFGMGIPQNETELEKVMDESIVARGHMMVEEYISGTEITCAVLGGFPGEAPIALPLTEIIPKNSAYFDFEAKYTPGASEEITPARLDPEITALAQDIGVRSHIALGCGGMSRTDMIVRDREVFYLETNTIPGMTETSLYPQAARAMGMDFRDLLTRQVELAIAYHRRKRA